MEANAGESFQMQILSNIFPRISLHCKLVPVRYRVYEYGLLVFFIRKFVNTILILADERRILFLFLNDV